MKKYWIVLLSMLAIGQCLLTPVYAQQKEELVLAFGGEPDEGFDPIKGWGRYGSPLFQSTLLKRNTDLEVTTDLAQSYEVSSDRLTWTIQLKEDIVFTDGQPLTTKDVAFTFDTAKKKGTATVDLSNLIEIEIVNDHEMKFHLDKPDVTFISKMCSLGIVPKHAYRSDYGIQPIGSGPLEFIEWKKGEQLITKVNESYYGDKIPYKKITFLFTEADQAMMLAQSNAADVIRISYKDAHVKVPGYTLVALDSIDNRGIIFPVRKNEGQKTPSGYPIGNNVTSDIHVRKAINIAIDRQQIIDHVLNGFGTPASSIADKMPWWNEKTAIANDGNIKQANKLLDNAGWKLSKEGVRQKDGQEAKLPLYYAYKDRENIAVAIAQQLKEIGFDITPIYATWEEIIPKMSSDMVLFGWGGYDPLEVYYNYSSNWQGKDFYNPNYYANETVDHYFDQALRSENEEEAQQYWQKAQWDGREGLSHLGDAPWAWIINEQHLYLVRENLDIGRQKIQPHGGGWPLTDTLQQWKWK